MYRGGKSVSPSSPFEKHDTTLEAAYSGHQLFTETTQQMGRGAEVASRFSFSRGRGGSRDIFFLFSPKERRRVVTSKGLSNALFYFGPGRCNRSSMLRYVENRLQGRRRGRSKRFLPFSFVAPGFTSVPSRFTERQRQPTVAERRRMYDRTDLSPSELRVFLKKISFVTVSTREKLSL